MTSAIDICNRALIEAVARANVSNFDERTSEAGACRTLYPAVRDQALRAARWNFTRKTTTLTLLKAAPGTPEQTTTATDTWNSNYPALPWLYSYAKPADAIAFWKVSPQWTGLGSTGTPLFPVQLGTPYNSGPNDSGAARFQLATDTNAQGAYQNVILTNVSQAIGVYGVKIEDPNLWDASFQEVVVQALSGKLAVALGGNIQLAQSKIAAANAILMQARAQDGNEGTTIVDIMPDWIAARGYGQSRFEGLGYGMAPYGPLF